jgi:hypothetical protein
MYNTTSNTWQLRLLLNKLLQVLQVLHHLHRQAKYLLLRHLQGDPLEVAATTM